MPTKDEYMATVGDKLTKNADSIYQYLNFNQMPEYTKKIIPIAEVV